MIIEPKTRQFISTTAHPDGCHEHVKNQIEYVKSQAKLSSKIKNVLVIGASTGYGLSSRIAAAYGLGANTVGVMLERAPRAKRTGSAGYYNDQAFQAFADKDNLKHKSINADAFSVETKALTVETFKELCPGEKIDLVIYSLAAPRRSMQDGTTYSSVIKPIGQTYTSKALDMDTKEITETTIEPATPEEVEATIKVMGGSDWEAWIDYLDKANILADNALTIAYSYIGPDLTAAIYTEGSIGMAKNDLYETAQRMRSNYQGKYRSYVSINKAVVTQSSAVIPSIGLYISLLFKVMKEQGTHEDTIQQMYRLFSEHLASADGDLHLDENEFIRLDDYELAEKVQKPVHAAWDKVSSQTVDEYCDLKGFWSDFYALFGFGMDNVDYSKDVDLASNIGRGDL